MGNRKGWNSVNNTENKDGTAYSGSGTSYSGSGYVEFGAICSSPNEYFIPKSHIQILFDHCKNHSYISDKYALGEIITLFWDIENKKYRDYVKGVDFDISCMVYERTPLLEKQMIQDRKDAGFLIPDIYSLIINYNNAVQKITTDIDNREFDHKKKKFPHKKGDIVLLLVNNKLEAYGIENIWEKSIKLFGIDISKTMYVCKQWFIEHFYEKITLK